MARRQEKNAGHETANEVVAATKIPSAIAGKVLVGKASRHESLQASYVAFWHGISERKLKKANRRMTEYQKSAVDFLNQELAPHYKEFEHGDGSS